MPAQECSMWEEAAHDYYLPCICAPNLCSSICPVCHSARTIKEVTLTKEQTWNLMRWLYGRKTDIGFGLGDLGDLKVLLQLLGGGNDD